MAETHDRKAQRHNFYFNQNKIKSEKVEEKEEIELSLGLSLNGRFGSLPTRSDMVRSSSVSGFGGVATEGGADVVLWRTRSVPTEERRRRKEEQTVRRMEARRKRVGKMMREKARRVGRPIRERHVAVLVSQGSGSSGVSESVGHPINQVENKSPNARSPETLPDQNESKQTAPIGETKSNIHIPSTKSNRNITQEMMKNMMVDMPCVSTRVVGPNGKKIEGFLYRYKKGEEVRIVCVCHGSFLTPAEFVKHAGGGDVAHPLKHIVVNPSPLL